MENKAVSPTRNRRSVGGRNGSAPSAEATFEKNYMRYIASNLGLGKLATKKALSTRILILVVSVVLIVAIVLFALTGPLPPVFVIPFALIVVALITIPAIYLIVKSLFARKKFKLLSKMVKKLRYEPTTKGYFIRNKGHFYTFLVYDESVEDALCREELEKVNEIIASEEKRISFEDLYYAVSDAELKGKLVLTDFSKKITDYTTDKTFPLIQVSFKLSNLSDAVVTGYPNEFNFILFPPTVWIERGSKSRKKTKSNLKRSKSKENEN